MPGEAGAYHPQHEGVPDVNNEVNLRDFFLGFLAMFLYIVSLWLDIRPETA